jgi:hypothetical protein
LCIRDVFGSGIPDDVYNDRNGNHNAILGVTAILYKIAGLLFDLIAHLLHEWIFLHLLVQNIMRRTNTLCEQTPKAKHREQGGKD